MNQKSEIRLKNDENIFKFSFNQEYTSLSVISNNTFKIFSLAGVDKVDEIFSSSSENAANVKIVERLFSSSLIAIVNYNEQNKLKMCHIKKRSDICEFKYPKHILNVAMNRSRLVVCLKDSIYIHNMQDMRLLHSIKNLSENPSGIVALSTKNCLAYPISRETGKIQLVDVSKMKVGSVIEAHNSRVVIMKFSSCGDMLATGSSKGTVIRIFSVISKLCLIEFRRSCTRYAQISSLNFSLCGSFISVSSNTDTIHVFKIDPNVKDILERERSTEGSDTERFSILSVVSKAISGVLLQDRAHAYVQLYSDVRKNCVIAELGGQTCLLVACDDGFLYIYQIDKKGGECALSQVHDLRNDLDFAQIGTAESLENSVEERVIEDELCDDETITIKENENPIEKSTYADIIKKGNNLNDTLKNNTDNNHVKSNYPIGHDNFTYDDGFPPVCRA